MSTPHNQAEQTHAATGSEASGLKFEWREALWYVPAISILVWWLYDLHFQWSALVEYQYGWLVVMLAAYLFWERWETLPRKDKSAPFWLCGLLAMAGTPLVLIAELYKQGIARSPAASFSLSVGCTLFLAANILYVRGWATMRHLLFPLLFLYVAVPLPKIFWDPVVLSLQQIITTLNVETLKLCGIPAVQHANVIQLPLCNVGVDEACSGVRSLQSSIMAALFIGDLTLKRFGSRLSLFVAGIGLALVGNYFRSLYLAVTAHQKGIDSLKAVHDVAGWSILVFTAGGLVVVAWMIVRWEKFVTQAGSHHQTRVTNERREERVGG